MKSTKLVNETNEYIIVNLVIGGSNTKLVRLEHKDEYTITTDENATFRQYSVTFARGFTPVEFSSDDLFDIAKITFTKEENGQVKRKDRHRALLGLFAKESTATVSEPAATGSEPAATGSEQDGEANLESHPAEDQPESVVKQQLEKLAIQEKSGALDAQRPAPSTEQPDSVSIPVKEEISGSGDPA